MGPPRPHETGHFYFAQTGHSHFAATDKVTALFRLFRSVRVGGTPSSQIGYAELNDFRRTLLAAEVRNRAQRVVEAVGEISGADHQRELNNLTFVVILAQLLKGTGADRGSTAGDPLGVKNRRLLFFVEERAALVELQSSNLLVVDANPLRRGGVSAVSILARVDQCCFLIDYLFVT